MIIDVGNVVNVVVSLGAMAILIFIGVAGFKQNSKKHNKNGGSTSTTTTKSSDSSK